MLTRDTSKHQVAKRESAVAVVYSRSVEMQGKPQQFAKLAVDSTIGCPSARLNWRCGP